MFATQRGGDAGQGQAVTIAGVQVGLVGGVQLEHGQAVVTMNIFRKYAPIYRDATVLLRPRTPLKDMYLALDPGTRAGRRGAGRRDARSGQHRSPTSTSTRSSASLDADTRTYLLLLLSGGARRVPGRRATGRSPAAASGTFKRFAPLDRDARTFATLLAARSRNLRLAIHNLQRVATLARRRRRAAGVADRSPRTRTSPRSRRRTRNLEAGLALLPGTLEQTNQTLGKVQGFAYQLGRRSRSCSRSPARSRPALEASRPLFHDTTPVIQNQLRPFSIAVQPLAKALKPAATELSKAVPPLTSSVGVINTLFNTLAYQPAGSEQGYLFWGAWLAHIADSLTDLQDAQGPTVRGIFMASCRHSTCSRRRSSRAVRRSRRCSTC